MSDLADSGRTDDWDALYEIARARLPDIYRALTSLDLRCRDRIRAGAREDDEELANIMRDHDALIAALRVVRSARTSGSSSP